MTTTTPYIPKPHSKIARAVAFFQANPDEELTADELAAKFGMVRGSVHTLLRPALDAGLLKRIRDDLGEYIYQRGPNLDLCAAPCSDPEDDPPASEPTDFVPGWPPAPQTTQRGKRKLILDPKQIAALPVDTDVPFQPPSMHEGHKWEPLFSKLTQAGHSVQFPVEWKTAVAATAQKLNRKATTHAWRVRVVSDTHARLWRLAK